MLDKHFIKVFIDRLLRIRKSATLDFELGAAIRIINPASGAVSANISTDELAKLDTSAATRLVNLTAATLALTAALHDSRTVTVNRAAGATITLPASIGNGAKYRVVVGTTLTSGSLIIQVANSTDVMQGQVQQMSDDPATVKAFATVAASDTITLNRTTTGVGVAGEFFTFEDVAAGFWQVHGISTATGTEATPFSAAV